MQLLFCFVDAFAVLAVNNEDEALRAGVIMPPEGPDFVLSSNVPDVELDVFIRDSFNVEADFKGISTRDTDMAATYLWVSWSQTG